MFRGEIHWFFKINMCQDSVDNLVPGLHDNQNSKEDERMFSDMSHSVSCSGNTHHYGPVLEAGVAEVEQGMPTCLHGSWRPQQLPPDRITSRTSHACRLIYYMLVTCFVVNMLGLVLIHLGPHVINVIDARNDDVNVRSVRQLSSEKRQNSPEILRRLMAVDSDLLQDVTSEKSTLGDGDGRNVVSPFVNMSAGAEEEWGKVQRGFSASHIEFPLNEARLCNDDTFLFIMVASAVGNIEKRQTIRDTWGSPAAAHVDHHHHHPLTAKLVFLVGKPPGENRSISEDIKSESLRYKDLIQTNSVDSYSNLSFKSIAMLKWMTRYCKSAKFLLKSDDDMFINIDKLKQELANSVHRRFIMGEIIAGAQPMQDKNSKWYTPRHMFPSKMYPKYVSGSAYVISGDFISDMYTSSLHTKVFWVEDVYITGLVAKKAKATYVYNSKFGYKRRRLSPCLFKNIVTCHRLSSKEMHKIWKAINDPNMICSAES